MSQPIPNTPIVGVDPGSKDQSVKFTVRVTIEKLIEIELTPAVFHNMTLEAYLAAFRSGLWHVDDLNDVAKYAARMAAYHGIGHEHDGIGLMGTKYTTHPRKPDVIFCELEDSCEEEIEVQP